MASISSITQRAADALTAYATLRARHALPARERSRSPTSTDPHIAARAAGLQNIITSLNWFFGTSLAAFASNDRAGALRHLTSANHTPPGKLLLGVMGELARELHVALPWQPVTAMGPVELS